MDIVSSVDAQHGPRVVRGPATAKDLELFAHIDRTLYTAVISDSLDELGYRDQAMRKDFRPLSRSFRCSGWARTIVCIDVFEIPDDSYGIEIEAIDSLLTGEIAVVSTGDSERNAPWGELLSTASRTRGARGAIIGGLVRDAEKIIKLGFPVFATGIKPVDSKGRGLVIDYNVPTECGGVTVNPGDLVVADYDGVVVIPAEIAGSVVALATEKVAKENHSRAELESGAYLADVYRKYGVL
ncbi:MAG: RraA family protein [Bryobacterales bacterium]|nr:RraA family protein [Bryobacterales bacterium]